MDLVQTKDQGACSEVMLTEKSVSPDISGMSDEVRDPEVLPRIGDDYQAEIPPFEMKSDDFRLLKNRAGSDVGGVYDTYIGLPVPVVWINNVQTLKQKQCNGSVSLVLASNQNGFHAVIKMQDVSEAREVRPGDDTTNRNVDNATSSGSLTKCVFQQENGIEKNKNNVDEGRVLVPNSSNDSWSDMEVDSLLLGLYIFGKNLNLVKKFVGTKKMGDILSFYYGKFYRSVKYRRWLACRKAKGKKCVCGQKLLTGWRLQELVSRLLSPLSEEKQNSLMEVSRRFTEGKIPLEEYVFSLKVMVGLNALVEAVGIGGGKQDLTTITTDPNTSNHIFPSRLEIPVGKACSTLTPVEIVKFLTGGFRLSKARSSDLFWEAVWPRLLAKGWHSEQANHYASTAGLKHSLVFLIPGVKKFCRRKLVKGEHYFDSVSDVLNKVASNPGLLELDTDVDKHCSEKEEIELASKTKQDDDGFSSQQRYCYLKPRILIHNTEDMKFMVVDTSLANGKAVKFRELRSLPVEIMNTHASRSNSNDDKDISLQVSVDDSCSGNSMHEDKEVTDVSNATVINLDKEVYFDGKISSNKEDDKALLENSQQSKGVQWQMSQEKPYHETDLTAFTKSRLQLNAFSQETSCYPVNLLMGPVLKQELKSSDHEDLSRNTVPRVDLSKENLPLTSLSRGSLVTSCADVPSGTCYIVEVPQPHTLIDLNLPAPQDPHNFGSSTMDISEHYSIKNSRRQSNRNRPLTTRALEAHALGLLDLKPKRKSRDFFF